MDMNRLTGVVGLQYRIRDQKLFWSPERFRIQTVQDRQQEKPCHRESLTMTPTSAKRTSRARRHRK
jgi:hypothetical protein